MRFLVTQRQPYTKPDAILLPISLSFRYTRFAANSLGDRAGTGCKFVTLIFCPQLEGVHKLTARDFARGLALAFDELADQILFIPIASSSCGNTVWRSKPLLLPFQTSFDSPIEDAGCFGPQASNDVAVAAVLRDLNGERDQFESSPDAFIGSVSRGTVVSVEPKLIRRNKVNWLAVEFSRIHHVAAI